MRTQETKSGIFIQMPQDPVASLDTSYDPFLRQKQFERELELLSSNAVFEKFLNFIAGQTAKQHNSPHELPFSLPQLGRDFDGKIAAASLIAGNRWSRISLQTAVSVSQAIGPDLSQEVLLVIQAPHLGRLIPVASGQLDDQIGIYITPDKTDPTKRSIQYVTSGTAMPLEQIFKTSAEGKIARWQQPLDLSYPPQIFSSTQDQISAKEKALRRYVLLITGIQPDWLRVQIQNRELAYDNLDSVVKLYLKLLASKKPFTDFPHKLESSLAEIRIPNLISENTNSEPGVFIPLPKQYQLPMEKFFHWIPDEATNILAKLPFYLDAKQNADKHEIQIIFRETDKNEEIIGKLPNSNLHRADSEPEIHFISGNSEIIFCLTPGNYYEIGDITLNISKLKNAPVTNIRIVGRNNSGGGIKELIPLRV